MSTNDEVLQVRDQLRAALEEGWRSFQGSDEAARLDRFLQYLITTGYYESEFRGVIPNPAYDNAAKMVGRRFLERARALRIEFDELFPGDYRRSVEVELPTHEERQFWLTAYRDGAPFCTFSIKFPHRHDRLDFPTPPELDIEPSAS